MKDTFGHDRRFDLPAKFNAIFAFDSPYALTALHRYWPPSSWVGARIVSVSVYWSRAVFFRVMLYRGVVSSIQMSPRNQRISGPGLASKMHSMIRSISSLIGSSSCLIVGFLGKRGGLPAGILQMKLMNVCAVQVQTSADELTLVLLQRRYQSSSWS